MLSLLITERGRGTRKHGSSAEVLFKFFNFWGEKLTIDNVVGIDGRKTNSTLKAGISGSYPVDKTVSSIYRNYSCITMAFSLEEEIQWGCPV